MNPILIHNALIINEHIKQKGSVLIESGKISEVYTEKDLPEAILQQSQVIDAENKILIPGVIDDHVHFREPGLTHKADIYSESKAAIAGGVTSYMEMPNTKPPAVTMSQLKEKFGIAEKNSFANFSFYLGATNANIKEIKSIDPREICGVKIFMGASTGNMLVDNRSSLEQIFVESPVLISAHCEDEKTIQNNIQHYSEQFSGEIPVAYHPIIRSEEACYKSSSMAVELARKYRARLHLLHLSTAKELELLERTRFDSNKHITAEACIHHLWFDDKDYNNYGTRIKWNPAIKKARDREALLKGVNTHAIDVVATDHAPHLLEEKNNTYLKAPSGAPMVQHSLLAMLEFHHRKKLSLNTIVEKMCHAPADIFNISKRGYIRKGYWADLVLIDPIKPHRVHKENILYKCGWSPLEGQIYSSRISHTFVNGKIAYQNGQINEEKNARKLTFER
ncbi:MAG: dihydroorotase [Bacteroidales bacterium]|nr:dihydroorotase [Bacteroidales bacterium]